MTTTPADTADTADAAEPKTSDAPAVNWDALISLASTEDKALVAKRAIVPVPPAVLALVKDARANGKRINLPYDRATYREVCDVFYSAGDMLEPKASVSIVRIRVVDGKDVVLQAKESDDGVTRVRISVNSRRGAKGDKPADKPADKTAEKPADKSA